MLPLICEAACGGGTADFVFDIGGDHAVSGGANDPITDWVYWYNPIDQSPGQSGYLAWEGGATSADPATAYDHLDAEVLARQVIVGFNSGTAPPYPMELPEQGTIFRIVTNKPLAPGDQIAITTTGLAPTRGDISIVEANIDAIGIVPNPYKGASDFEVTVLSDVVRFTNLPDQARIRVYTLGGTLIWDEMRGRDNNEWNLTTSENLPLASGMYLVVVDVEGVGKKIIKFGVVKKRIQLDLI
jgi:hypothetical protein